MSDDGGDNGLWGLLVHIVLYASLLACVRLLIMLFHDVAAATSLVDRVFRSLCICAPVASVTGWVARVETWLHALHGWMTRSNAWRFVCRVPRSLTPQSGDSAAAADADAKDSEQDEAEAKPGVGYLVFCAVGLMLCYLSWSFLQEIIMTQSYDGEHFTESEFLVLMNRVLALCVALMVLRHSTDASEDNEPHNTAEMHALVDADGTAASMPEADADLSDPEAPDGSEGAPAAAEAPWVVSKFRRQLGAAPLYSYSFCSISNVLSSWCQYEALKYVSFPMQVLAKSCKIIAAMCMGKALNGKSYPWADYGMAMLIAVGVTVFKVFTPTDSKKSDDEESSGISFELLVGLCMLLGYLVCDSFTSVWQSRVFKTHKVSPHQMMAGVNGWSSLFTTAVLLSSGRLFAAVAFLAAHPTCVMHVLGMSFCSAMGQLFIFTTINTFGPVVFASVMTTRQAVSILLSVLYFGHPMTGGGMVGIAIVFAALGFKVYRKSQASK